MCLELGINRLNISFFFYVNIRYIKYLFNSIFKMIVVVSFCVFEKRKKNDIINNIWLVIILYVYVFN